MEEANKMVGHNHRAARKFTVTKSHRVRTPRRDATQPSRTDLALSPAQEETVEALLEKKPEGHDLSSDGDGDWRPTFLAHLQQSANVRAASEAAGISRVMAYRAKRQDA